MSAERYECAVYIHSLFEHVIYYRKEHFERMAFYRILVKGTKFWPVGTGGIGRRQNGSKIICWVPTVCNIMLIMEVLLLAIS